MQKSKSLKYKKMEIENMEKDDDVWRSWQAPIREKFCTASLLTFHPSLHQPLQLQEEYDSSGDDEEEDLKTPHHWMMMMRMEEEEEDGDEICK